MNKTLLRAGVIGAGAIGQMGHIPGLQAADVGVFAICDANIERAREVAAKFKIPNAFSDYKELIALPEVDLITIGLPNALHAPVTIDALNAGKHVLCEKPITTSVKLADEMIAAAKKNDRLLSVNQHMRFEASSQAMRDIFSRGELGRVYLAEAKWIRQEGIPGYGGWFTQKELAGAGALFDIGVHLLDLALFVMNFPKVVRVKGLLSGELGKAKLGLGGWGADKNLEGKFDVDDTAFAVLTLEDGAQIRLLVTWAAFAPAEDRVSFFGTGGGLDRINHFTQPKNSLKQFVAKEGKIVETVPDLSTYDEGPVAWFKAIDSFVQAVRGKAPLQIDPNDSREVVRILEAIQRSSELGREIEL
jgi:predicted dehydrogenase